MLQGVAGQGPAQDSVQNVVVKSAWGRWGRHSGPRSRGRIRIRLCGRSTVRGLAQSLSEQDGLRRCRAGSLCTVSGSQHGKRALNIHACCGPEAWQRVHR